AHSWFNYLKDADHYRKQLETHIATQEKEIEKTATRKAAAATRAAITEEQVVELKAALKDTKSLRALQSGNPTLEQAKRTPTYPDPEKFTGDRKELRTFLI
ncbi:hypothetical protein MMC10_011350, partial [Thelotrema lepadinum]|nr:hypothetical protein [Thelotrema lepadinum]